MVFEDAHWSDPTSLELLTLTIERLQRLPMLLIITLRPEFQPPWTGQPHVTTLALNRLGRRERTALVGHVTGGKALPQPVLDQIVERTDGVPLFVEELTKAVLESDQLHEDRDRYVLDQPVQHLAIPTTLQASLMARVDRLGSAREVLQIGAAIGREFSYELLAPVAGLPDPVLQDALVRLTEAELVFARGIPPNSVYAFKHALVQDAAYSTMLRARRQQLHGAIASLLEKRFSDVVASTPEVIAQQFEGAGSTEQAIHYWRQAGDRDLRRFAMKEAVAHYSNALRVIMAMPESPARSERELASCLSLALANQISLGPSAKESADYYRRADTLSQLLPGRGREQFLATWGLWLHCFMTDQPHEAVQRADDMVRIAQQLNNPDLLMEAYHARTAVLQRRGDFRGITESADEVIRLYDRQRHRDHAYFFGGHDARVCVRTFYSMGLWGLGFFDQAREMVRACVDDARDLGHTFSLCHGLHQSGLTLVLLGDIDACQAVVDELLPLAERNKFPWPLAMGQFIQGWVMAQRGDQAGIKPMLASSKHPTAGVRRPLLEAVTVAELIRAERYEEALKVVDSAIKREGAIGFGLFQPEMLRLRADILLQESRSNADEAEAGLFAAVKAAREQNCRALELRATMSLARLRRDQGRVREARDVLAPIYAWFTEGFGWPDLRAAKALLAELR
jgi:predicted ATPase